MGYGSGELAVSSAVCGCVGLIIVISVAAAAGAAEELLLAYNLTADAGGSGGGCNLFYGKWAVDGTYPLYNNNGCPFIDPQFDCLKYGRPDKSFLHYSWKPAAATAAGGSCNFPRFEGGDLLKRWRGKKIMYVGDSLSLNMWQSMACMLHSAAAAGRASYSYARNAPIPYVTFKDYDLTIHFYHSNYLVDLVKEKRGMVLNLDSIQQGGGDVWKSMDVLIFNSWHWWTHTGTSQPWNFVQDGSNSYQDMDRLEAFSKGLTTWGKWVDQNVDPQRTKVFFQGISPSHYMGKEWGSPSKTCSGEKLPVEGSTYAAAAGGASEPEEVVKRVLNGIAKPVYLLDITLLSELRKDAHPSHYSGDHPGLDCSHWCLPGLPDTWNHLLYASLLQ